ncbi:hypothetical protein [Streptomyces sp. NBC_00038]|uniref:hypothetical protein n=1 Tax=Streptomyces sp. NBC_00038 TaxID=2903615 RepID=UPI00225A43AE|nr:hypothetical protein [Streptomyces sp. NBC_00038]MCX5560960.1 hypothetical protein [Streptomyces sp. NBC_00038]
MGTKTVDEAGVETGTEAKSDEEAVDLTKDDGAKADEAVGTDGEAAAGTPDEDEYDEDELSEAVAAKAPSGVGLGAAAVVSAALGLVSLTGGWLGTVAQARDSLYGQLETASTATVSTQIEQVYGNSWNANALVAGIFALVALLVGVFVLVRPAFGNPDRVVQATWVKSVAWAGVSLAIIGLLLAVLKYTDILLSMPTVSS